MLRSDSSSIDTARGSLTVLALASTSSVGMPNMPSTLAATSPVGPAPAITTFAELRASGWRSRTVKDELRANFTRALRDERELFPGIVGYDDTVIPQLQNAILSGQDMILLGERGQAKSRIIRSLTSLLDEATAAAEAMSMLFALRADESRKVFLVSNRCHPQTVAVLQTRAEPLDIELRIEDVVQSDLSAGVFGVLLQYPDTHGLAGDIGVAIARFKGECDRQAGALDPLRDTRVTLTHQGHGYVGRNAHRRTADIQWRGDRLTRT